MKTMLAIITVLGVLMMANQAAVGSPASDLMLDAEGCHACKTNCANYGLEKGQVHCHLITPAMRSEYVYPGQSSLEELYGMNVIAATECINLTADKTGLIILPGRKDMSGEYKVMSQQCSYGGGPVVFKKGTPISFKKLFQASFDPSSPGLYSWEVKGKEYALVFTKTKRLLVLDGDSSIVCAGDLIKGTLSLVCKASFASDKESKGDKMGRYCRTALVPPN